MAAFRLTVVGGPDRGREVVAPEGTDSVRIGREGAAGRDLVCSDKKISRRHATIEASARGVVLVDRGSTNGTRHNGRKVEPDTPVLLKNGDELSFGDETVVRFEFIAAPAARPERPEQRHVAAPEARPEPPTPSRGATSPAPEAPRRPPQPPPPPPRAPTPSPPPRAAAPRAPAAEPTERFENFDVYELLSDGDVDRVHVAVDTRSGRRVALKRLVIRKLTRKAYKRILEDCERGKRWNHPNIAQVLDCGDQGDLLYIASRLVEGKSLAELQTRFPRDFDIPLATYVAREICAALHYAETQESGFVHRNLHPRSILLGYGGEVVLINFGFVPVKVAIESTQVLNPMESRHLSPEHLAGRGVDARSDVFSVGAILYELLAQEPIDPRRKAVLPDVDTLRPEVPPPLAEITMKAVALRPEQRYRSAGEMEEELGEVLQKIAPGYGREPAAWMAKRFPGNAPG